MSGTPGIAELEAARRLLLSSLSAGISLDDVVSTLQDLESFRNALWQADHLLIQAMSAADLAEKHCVSSVEKLVAQVLRISPGDAKRRVRAATALGPRRSMVGEQLQPQHPALAAAQAAGEVSAVSADVILRTLGKADILVPTQTSEIEHELVRHAGVFDPIELGRICDRVVECLDPDGSRPRDAIQHDRRELHLSTCRDGMIKVDGRLTPGVGARVRAVLGPLAAPRATVEAGAQGGEKLVPDERTPGQRTHDALDEACARLLRSEDVPASGGTPATVIITMTQDQLDGAVIQARGRLDREFGGLAADVSGSGSSAVTAGSASMFSSVETSTGEVLSIAEALRLAAEAEVIPLVMTGTGQPLHVGRSRRCATTSQTYALIARDGGCSFPGCTVAPEWCERHHIVPWYLGGRTDIDNLTLLCGYHHAHFAQRGWTCRLGDDRLPEWRPPDWQRRGRAPLVNQRIRRRFSRPPDPRTPAPRAADRDTGLLLI